MPNPPRPEACTRTRPHSVIAAAIAAVALLPLSPVLKALLVELLRCCVDADHPGARFRVTVAHLMRATSRSRSSVGRDLAALRGAGWICRIQDKTRARRDGFKPGTTWLTPEAVALLFPLRASQAVRKTNAPSEVEYAWAEPRIPEALKPLLTRVRPWRVVWLMRRAKRAGQRVQTHLIGAMAADDPVGYLLHQFRPRRTRGGHTGRAPQTQRADTCQTGAAGHVGESLRYCGHVFASQSAGVLPQAANRERAREVRAALRR